MIIDELGIAGCASNFRDKVTKPLRDKELGSLDEKRR